MGGPKRQIGGTKLEAWESSRWQEEVDALRHLLHDFELDEVRKWNKPCYAHAGKNIAIIQEMKNFVALMFFKGALLHNSEGALRKPGDESNAARRFEFRSHRDIVSQTALIQRHVAQAIEIAKSGQTVAKPKRTLEFPEELHAQFEADPNFKAAFFALTPGRQRGYNLYFCAPKGTEARRRRIEKYREKILSGRGFHDR